MESSSSIASINPGQTISWPQLDQEAQSLMLPGHSSTRLCEGRLHVKWHMSSKKTMEINLYQEKYLGCLNLGLWKSTFVIGFFDELKL